VSARTQTKGAIQKPFWRTGLRQPHLEEGIQLEERHQHNSSHIQILSIDGHPVVQEGIGAILKSQADMSLVSAAATGEEGIEAYRSARPDVTLLDLQLPDLSGIEVLMGIRSEFPDARIIILATSEIAAGLAEHLSDENLSKREIEILGHVADGNRNRDIGEKLFIAEETVKVHLRHIMDKLGARDRTHSVTIAARRGFLSL